MAQILTIEEIKGEKIKQMKKWEEQTGKSILIHCMHNWHFPPHKHSKINLKHYIKLQIFQVLKTKSDNQL